MKDLDKNRINTFFEGSSSIDENFVADSFSEQENESVLKQLTHEQWEKTSSAPVDLQHILNKIHFDINSSKEKKSTSAKVLQLYYRAAAVLLIPMLVGGLLLWNSLENQIAYTKLTAPKGSRIQFTLPDGSNGNLNGGSTLTYATNFNSNRQVELRGEGYFNVKKRQKTPLYGTNTTC